MVKKGVWVDFDWSLYYWAELLKVVVTSYDHGEAFYDGRASFFGKYSL